MVIQLELVILTQLELLRRLMDLNHSRPLFEQSYRDLCHLHQLFDHWQLIIPLLITKQQQCLLEMAFLITAVFVRSMKFILTFEA